MTSFRDICWSLLLWLAAAPAVCAAPPALQVSRLEDKLQQFIEDGAFMGAVLVVADGHVLLDKGYGSANLEWSLPNTPQTKFRIGSLTKQFTAAAIFLLAEQGKVAIDDPAGKYLDLPAAWDGITIYQLLTHSSGVPNFSDIPEYWSRRSGPATPAQLLVMVRDRPLDFRPGSQWNYSNTGYDMLGMIVEKVSGKSYAEFLDEAVFQPLGMTDTGYDRATTLLSRRAAGYTRDGKTFQNAKYVDSSFLFSAGALYSTTHDLLKWEMGLFGGKVLSATSLKKMTAPFIATVLPDTDYGCGVFVHKINGHLVVKHPGFVDGFNAELLYVPDRKLTIAVLGNVSGPEPLMLASELAGTALEFTPQ